MEDQELLDRISAMSEQDLDSLPVGVITLDLAGKIVRYNKSEAELARIDQRAQIGRNFFADVAPCTAYPEFEGRFKELAAKQNGGITNFDYTFRFAWGPQRVHIAFVKKKESSTVDVLVTRL